MSADNTSPTVNQGTGGSSAWKVDGNGGTFPVSGSVTVSGTVTADQGTAGASAWKVDGTGGTFPVSGSVTISSGSVTVNNAAGASAVNIQDGGNSITVDGSVSASVTGSVTANAGTNLNTSLLQLDATGAKLNLAQGSTTSTQTGPLVQGAVTTSAPSYTNAQTSPLSLTTGGLLRVDGTGGSFPVSGTVAATQSTSPWVVSGTVNTTSDAIVDTNNSSTSTLLANATFTGTATDMLNYSTIRVSVFADQNSATNGWQVQFSEDNSHWDFVRQTTYAASTGGYTVFNRIARYVRVVFTNGTTNQGAFRLQTLLAPNSPEFARHFISEVPNDNNGSIITQSVVVGKTTGGGGGYVAVKVNPSGTLTVDASNSTGLVAASTITKSAITAAGGSFASSGNNTVITPSNSLHLSYISLSAAAANTAAVICIVKFTTGGSTLYEVQLLPGAIWAHNIGGGSNYVTGTTGQALVVNLDSAQTVYYSIEYADV